MILLLTVCAFVAGINVSSNLLLLVFSLFLSLILLSPFMGCLALQGIILKRGLPERCIEGKEFPVIYDLEGSGWFPKALIRVQEAENELMFPVSTIRLKRGDVTRLRSAGKAGHRGRLHWKGVWISTTFPFGLLNLSVYRAVPATIPVVPRYGRISLPYGGASGRQWGSVSTPAGRAGNGQEFYGVREWMPGESPRRIHWKWTAKRRKIMVIQEEELLGGPLGIYVDMVTVREGESFEQLMRKAASVCYSLLSKGGMVTVVWAEKEGWFVREQLQGLEGFHLILDGLACASARDRFPVKETCAGLISLSEWLILSQGENPVLPWFLEKGYHQIASLST